MEYFADAKSAYAKIAAIYDQEVAKTQAQLARFLQEERPPELAELGRYPQIQLSLPSDEVDDSSRPPPPGGGGVSVYSTTLARPALFEQYLLDQIGKVAGAYACAIGVGVSDSLIPLPFAVEMSEAGVSVETKSKVARRFAMPNLVRINDDIVDGRLILERDPDRPRDRPLAPFTAERIDYSLHRLRHYTATDPKYFQDYILFTNYQRYVDEFVELARTEVNAGRADCFAEPGGAVTYAGAPPQPPISKPPQMPAYHLCRPGKRGVTLINIGVGPSNAKTITDHVAVLRPHVWLMVGHCGGLRKTQRVGDYVLAHAYLRDDAVLDDVLPTSIPLPTLAEVQLALSQAVQETSGLAAADFKKHLRTGTVVTTADRNWELMFEQNAIKLNRARAIAIDMESATIAANGYRFRVPYGTLLCVSDRPLHGEIKLPRMADAFYEERVSQHLRIGIRALALLEQEADTGRLHSRKLRSFDEPLFR